MERWAKWLLAAVCLALVGVGIAVSIGAYRWQSATSRLQAQLLAAVPAARAESIDFAELQGLPEPVARYFRHVLQAGRPLVQAARLTQEGAFRIGQDEKDWRPLQATQYFIARRPGFLWDAEITMLPLLPVRVRDVYFAGQGEMRASLAGIFRILDERDKAELNAGALQRYLAEAVWFPTALLPSQGVQWHALDAHSALAMLRDGDTTVSLQFRFNAVGEIVEAYTPRRYREVNGRYLATPWRARYEDYQLRNGMRIPVAGVAEWVLPQGAFPYWRARLIGILYDFGAPDTAAGGAR